jgi:hypothetical protein
MTDEQKAIAMGQVMKATSKLLGEKIEGNFNKSVTGENKGRPFDKGMKIDFEKNIATEIERAVAAMNKEKGTTKQENLGERLDRLAKERDNKKSKDEKSSDRKLWSDKKLASTLKRTISRRQTIVNKNEQNQTVDHYKVQDGTVTNKWGEAQSSAETMQGILESISKGVGGNSPKMVALREKARQWAYDFFDSSSQHTDKQVQDKLAKSAEAIRKEFDSLTKK